MAKDDDQHLAILRRKHVESRTGLSRSTIYQRMAEGQFPRPIKLGANSVGWIEEEVDEFLKKLVAESRSSNVLPSIRVRA